MVKHILEEEECRSVGKAKLWWDNKLAIAIAVKPPSVVQETLDVLEEKGEFWGDFVAKQIQSKLCSTCRLVFVRC